LLEIGPGDLIGLNWPMEIGRASNAEKCLTTMGSNS
jgi:hypothetical protein